MSLGTVADALARFVGIALVTSGPIWLYDPVKCEYSPSSKRPQSLSCDADTYCHSRSSLRSTPYESRHSDIRPIPRRPKHGRRRDCPCFQLPRIETPYRYLPCLYCNWCGLVGYSGVFGEGERAQAASVEYRDYIHCCHPAHRGMNLSILNWP